MKIRFMGAAQDGHRLLLSSWRPAAIGSRSTAACIRETPRSKSATGTSRSTIPAGIEFMLMTHAHMDHSGLLPRLVQKGFHGKVYMTPPTRDLLRIMLLDSAHIQEMEAQWKSRKRLRYGDAGRHPPLHAKGRRGRLSPLFRRELRETFSPVSGADRDLPGRGPHPRRGDGGACRHGRGQDEPDRLLRRSSAARRSF